MEFDFEVVVQAVMAVAAVIGGVYGAWERIKRGEYEAGFQEVRKAGLATVAAIDLLPESRDKRRAKRLARYFAEKTGAEGPALARMVRDVRGILADTGFDGGSVDPDESGGANEVRLERAAARMAADREGPREKAAKGGLGGPGGKSGSGVGRVGVFFLAVVLAVGVAGCSVMTTEFTDVDGTAYKTRLLVAPFSEITGNDAQMVYRWQNGDGSIGVGQGAESMDQSGQGRVLEALAARIIEGYMMSQTGGASAVAGGGVE